MNATYNDIDGTEAGRPPTKPKRWPWIAGIVAALFIGAAIGSAGGDTAPTAEPEVVTETETVVETVTETVEVEVTPDACKKALDYAKDTTTGYEDLIELKSELIELTAVSALELALGDDSGTFDDQLAEFTVRQDELIAEKDEALVAFVAAGIECDPEWTDR